MLGKFLKVGWFTVLVIAVTLTFSISAFAKETATNTVSKAPHLSRTITADTYIAHFGQTVRSFTFERLPRNAAKVKAEDFQITNDITGAVVPTEAERDVLEVEFDMKSGNLTLKVEEFRYFASNFEVTYTGKENLDLSFTKEQVTSVTTEIADEFQAFENDALKYRLYVPENATKPLPLVVWTHGGGERGNDNWAQIAANRGATAWVEKFEDVIVLAPQVEVEWGNAQLESVRNIILGLIEDGIVDAERIYGSGASFGGKGIILNAGFSSDLFTAIAPICPTNDQLSLGTLESLVNMPIWISTAFGDTRPTRHVDWTASIEKLNEVGNNNAQITLYQPEEFQKYNLGFANDQNQLLSEYHHAWVLTLNNEHGIMDWLFEQR